MVLKVELVVLVELGKQVLQAELGELVLVVLVV
mgnify:FL=1